MEILGIPFTDAAALIVGFCSTFYTLYKIVDYFNAKFHFVETKKTKTEAKLDKIEESLESLSTKYDKLDSDNEAMKAASISRIKQQIVDKHNQYMREGAIDYMSLDCLQQQFKAYEAMGGNSYAHSLMQDLESLPLKEYQGETE